MQAEGSRRREPNTGVNEERHREKGLEDQWAVKALVLRSPVSMALLDAEGNVQAVSLGFRRLFGVPDQVDMTGLNVFEDMATTKHGTAKLFRSAQEGEVVDFHDVEFLSPFGAFTVTSGRAFPLRDEEGVVRFLVIVHSTEGKTSSATSQFERKKFKALATLFGRGSRRVAAQMSTLQKLLALARESLSQGKTDVLPNILEEALTLIDQVASVAESVTGLAQDTTITKTPVHMGDLATEVAAEFRQSTVQIETQVDSDLWNCHCDRTQTASVLEALLENAVRFTPEDGTVKVFVQNTVLQGRPDLPDGNYVAVRVEDDGPGVDPEILPHVFDPYFTTDPNSAGLGLAMAQTVVKSQGGKIWLESLGSHGTRAHLLLPADPSISVMRVAEDAEGGAKGQGPVRILVMDDNPNVRKVVVRMLESLGCLVDSVADGHDAVRMASTAARLGKQYHMVILDLTVPQGMGGLEALRRIKTISPNIHAVATSGHETEEAVARHKELGFSDFVPKPFKMDDLERILKTILKDE